MQPIDATTEIAVNLQAQEWNALLDIISRYSAVMAVITGFSGASPLAQRIGQQLQDSVRQTHQGKPNGGDRDPVMERPNA